MPNKALSLLLIFSLAFNIAFVGIWVHNIVTAEQDTHPERRGAADFWRNAGLDPEQREALREDSRTFKQEMAELGQELDRQQDRLLTLMAGEEPDEEAMRQCREKIHEIDRRRASLALKHMRRMREVLTPPQRRRWLEEMRRLGHGRGPGGHRGGFRPPPGGPPRPPLPDEGSRAETWQKHRPEPPPRGEDRER